MADPKRARKFSEEFKRQIVEMYDNGKPTAEMLEEYDLGSSTLHRWVKSIHENGSTRAADNRALDEMSEVFGITRSLPKKGCPCDNAVVESTNKILKAEFVYRENFKSLEDLQAKLSDYVWWYNHERMHSKLGCMSPVEFRKAGLSL